MINTSEHKNEDIVKSGVVDYPIGFPFYFNPDRTPQLLVKIGDEELRYNHNFGLSEDNGSVLLRPTEEESWTLEGPEDFSWMTKWDGKDLLIERVVPFIQDSDYQLGRISSEQIERDFDLSVMRDQEIRNQADKDRAEIEECKNDILANAEKVYTKEETTAILEEYMPLAGKKNMLGWIGFDGKYNPNGNQALIAVQTASGVKGLIGAATDDDGMLRDVAVIDKLKGTTVQYSTVLATQIGSATNHIPRVFAKKISSGSTLSMITIPEAGGTMARLEDLESKQDKLSAGDNIIISGNTISAIGGGAGLEFIVVQELPETGEKGIVYLLAKDGTAPDVYDEYVWINATQTFELIGSTKVDLTDYATKGELAGELAGYLPLSGGSLTGDLSLGEHKLNFRGGVSVIGNGNIGGIWVEYYDNIVSISANTRTITGIQKLNNGEDIIIPTTGGTLARIEDLENIDALPDQTGNAGKVLITDGSTASWQEAPASGTKVIIKRYN